jgi:hypothetical protein
VLVILWRWSLWATNSQQLVFWSLGVGSEVMMVALLHNFYEMGDIRILSFPEKEMDS